MDDNQAPVMGGAPNLNQANNTPEQPVMQPVEPVVQPEAQPLTQPVAQPEAQPLTQPVAQPVMQPVVQPVAQQAFQPVVSGPNATGAKKRQGLIIGCIVGGVALIALVVLLIVLLGGRGGGKTVSCKSSTTIMGLDISAETVFDIKDGEISSGIMKGVVDLTSLSDSYKAYEEQLAGQVTESVKAQCESHCKFDSKYNKGNNIEYTLTYDSVGTAEYIGTGGAEKNMSAQEIVDKIVGSTPGYGTVCTQK